MDKDSHTMAIALYFCLIWVCCFRLSYAQDPCDGLYHEELHRGKYRGTQCTYIKEKPVCDDKIKDGWYKVKGLNGPLQMPESPTELSKCGTNFPIWMNGSHPTADEAEVKRKGCIRDHQSFCSTSFDIEIKVKNCSTFFVYHLVHTAICNMAYCFGIDQSCPPFDPCDVYEHEELDNRNGDRSSMCPTVGSPKSDETLVQRWYRIRGTNGLQVISSHYPDYMSCSTQYPVWINGSIPAAEENIVKRVACVRTEMTYCAQSFGIEIKNCSTHVVYNLTATQPDQRYCTDDKIMCIDRPTTETSVNLTDKPQDRRAVLGQFGAGQFGADNSLRIIRSGHFGANISERIFQSGHFGADNS